MTLEATKVSPPDNVPPECVRDFNMFAPPGGEHDVHSAWRTLQQTSPDFVWTPYHGGHWLPMRFEDIDYVQRNHDPFSMHDVSMPGGVKPIRILPLEANPPEHIGFRMIVNPFFTPRRVNELEASTRELAISLIEGFKPAGTCEFMQDFALKLPIAVFMKLADLSMDDAPYLLELTEQVTRGGPEAVPEAYRKMMEYIVPVIEARRTQAGSDLISAVVHAKVKGNPLSQDDVISILTVVLFGGLDTVASSMGFMAEHLARSPEGRRELIENPSLIPNAVYEMIRRFASASNARTLSRDFEYKGIMFRKGDKIFPSTLLAGIDEHHFPNGYSIDFHRNQGENSAFGAGPHRCPGQLLALLEMKIFIEEWLKAIPDFRVSGSEPPRYAAGLVNCVTKLVLEWDR